VGSRIVVTHGVDTLIDTALFLKDALTRYREVMAQAGISLPASGSGKSVCRSCRWVGVAAVVAGHCVCCCRSSGLVLVGWRRWCCYSACDELSVRVL
jgi:hypothetical protein